MTERRFRGPICALLLALAAALPTVTMARATEKPLIWTPMQTSATSYAMRMGSRLPTDLEASAGAELSFAGRQAGRAPQRVANPVRFWGSVQLPASRAKTRSARLDMNLNAVTGNRSVALSRSRSLDLTPDISAQIEDLYSVDYDRGAARHVGARASSTLRLRAHSTSTSLFARGARSSRDQEWQASVGVEQKISGNLNLSAGIDNLTAPSPTGSIRAGYAHRW
ncbi:hypothetical protein [Pseudaminobacter salicylatoxidans]|uniref:hypothetical protein n=1 Tax=Pseudaminobacter salicylatoxidans TaxID=93369 RepID=UPI0003024224|nr:hypothetical protein [Pseudaminobacter salicylatoxidans]